MDELSINLNNCKKGCCINGQFINHLFYADDSVILAPSSNALQELLNVCSDFAFSNELSYNVKKTECMIIKPKSMKSLCIPTIRLCGQLLKFTNLKKYLGCIISNDLTDNEDIKRQTRCTYTQGNVLIKKFRKCTIEVKTKLF